MQDFNKLNSNNISDEYFIILHNSGNSQTKYINSKTFDFSFCSANPILFENEILLGNLKYANDDNKKIDIDKIIYGRKLGIDLFNPYSDFLNDICFKFTSEKGTDVTLQRKFALYFI